MRPFGDISIWIFLALFIPGFVSLKVYDLLVPSERRDLTNAFLEVISFGSINFAITYWLTLYIHSNNFGVNNPVWYYMLSVVILFVVPVFLPIVYLKLMKIPFVAGKIIHPIPKPWDYVFGKRESYWMIVHLKDGRKIGGRYDTNSFASSYPAEEQVYIEEVWIIDNDGRFKEKVERSKGIIISKEDISVLEFFE